MPNKNCDVDIQYVWGQDVDRFLKLGNFASTTNTHDRRDRENEFCMWHFLASRILAEISSVKNLINFGPNQ